MLKHFSRALSLLTVSVLLLLLAGGCDFIRASLGKPTSADIEILRREKAERERIAAAEAAVRDSIAKADADSMAALDKRLAAIVLADSARLKTYYAVAGAFKEESGAQAYVDRLTENGFRVKLFDFKSGLKVVCVEGSDSIEDVRKDVAALKKLRLSPSDPWIYNTNQKLHKQI